MYNQNLPPTGRRKQVISTNRRQPVNKRYPTPYISTIIEQRIQFGVAFIKQSFINITVTENLSIQLSCTYPHHTRHIIQPPKSLNHYYVTKSKNNRGPLSSSTNPPHKTIILIQFGSPFASTAIDFSTKSTNYYHHTGQYSEQAPTTFSIYTFHFTHMVIQQHQQLYPTP